MIKLIKSFTASFCLLMFASMAFAGMKPPAQGDLFPKILLTAPQSSTHQQYLGLPGEGTFTIPQIKAKVVIVEIFSMYCPYCQKEAPVINELYRQIHNNNQIKDSVKLIGIGVGNTAFEVEHFRNTYQISFPLFPDGSFSIHKTIGEVRTPYFFIIEINKDGTHRILLSKPGRLKDPDKFLDTIIQHAGFDPS